MRYRTLLIIAAMALSVSAFAVDKPPMDIPIYPGGETSLELNLTNEEFLPMMQALLPMLSGKLGELAEKVKPEEIAEALKDLKRIELVQVNIPRGNCTEMDIASFYMKNVPAGKWSRLFWQSSDRLGTVALYSLEGFGGFYGFRVSKKMEDGKLIYQAMVGRIEGTIDFVKLLTIAAKVMVTQ